MTARPGVLCDPPDPRVPTRAAAGGARVRPAEGACGALAPESYAVRDSGLADAGRVLAPGESCGVGRVGAGGARVGPGEVACGAVVPGSYAVREHAPGDARQVPAPGESRATGLAGTDGARVGPGEAARGALALEPFAARNLAPVDAVQDPASAEMRASGPAGTTGAPVAPPGPRRTPSRTLRFAALGDSLTEGVGDPVSGGWRGWAALLAGGIGDTGNPAVFRNFAVSGALAQDVAERQAAQALAFEPDIASVLVGVNDTLRRSFDIADLTRRLDSVCGRLAARGTVLLTACLPDPGSMFGLPLPLARPLARRQRAVNAVVHALSTRYGAVHLHASDGVWVLDRSMWSADRLHPGERGHRLIARRFHELLTDRGLAHGTPPGTDPTQPPPTLSATVLWLATAGTGWVVRRCTDLLPQLVRLGGAEVHHWARGTGDRLDRSAEHALSAALAAVSLETPLVRMGE